jgi:hypothetical protein
MWEAFALGNFGKGFFDWKKSSRGINGEFGGIIENLAEFLSILAE